MLFLSGTFLAVSTCKNKNWHLSVQFFRTHFVFLRGFPVLLILYEWQTSILTFGSVTFCLFLCFILIDIKFNRPLEPSDIFMQQ